MAQSSHRRHFSLEEERNPFLYLCHFGWHKCSSGYSYGPSIRDFFLIHYIKSGKGIFECNNQQFQLSAGQSFIIHPGETTTYYADSNEPWEYYYFSLSGSHVPALIEMTGFSNNCSITQLNNDRITAVILDAMNEIDEKPNKFFYGISVLTTLLDLYIQKESLVHSPLIRKDSYAEVIKDYIDFNYSDKLLVDDLASTMSISRNHLYRLFKNEYGLSPTQYIELKRLNLASKVLIESDLSAQQIAFIVGYSTYSAFYRLFINKYGESPSQYRNKNKL